MGFSMQESWSGLLFLIPGDLLDPGSSSGLFLLLHWKVGSLPLAPPGKPSLLHNTLLLLLLVLRSL